MKNMTGSFAEDACEGVQMLRKRQSSLCAPTRAHGSVLVVACGQAAPTSVAARTPVHFASGCGARQRRLPTGAAA